MCFLLLESLSENYEIVERVKILEKYGEKHVFYLASIVARKLWNVECENIFL